jgi:hypothetical protein
VSDVTITPTEEASALGQRRWLILAVVGLAQLMVILDLTVMNIALPSAPGGARPQPGRRLPVILHRRGRGPAPSRAAGPAAHAVAGGCRGHHGTSRRWSRPSRVIRLRELGGHLGARPWSHEPLELGSNQATLPEGMVVAMAQDKQWVVDTLRRLGYEHEADEAARVLPDPVETEQLSEFGDRYGISMAELMSRMGGSP